MLGSSVGSQYGGPSDRISAPSGRVTGARRLTLCSAMSSVSVAKRQSRQIVLAVVAYLLSGTVAQQEGSSVASYQTPQDAREVSSASLVSQHSTDAWRTVEEGLQNPFTEVQSDLLALGRNQHTRNSVTDPVDPTVPIHIAGTSWDPSKTSGLLDSSSPVAKNSLEVLDPSKASGLLTSISPVAKNSPEVLDPSKASGLLTSSSPVAKNSLEVLDPNKASGLLTSSSPVAKNSPEILDPSKASGLLTFSSPVAKNSPEVLDPSKASGLLTSSSPVAKNSPEVVDPSKTSGLLTSSSPVAKNSPEVVDPSKVSELLTSSSPVAKNSPEILNPSKASGLLTSSSPVTKNSLEVLDPSKASGLLTSSFPVTKNSLEVLDPSKASGLLTSSSPVAKNSPEVLDPSKASGLLTSSSPVAKNSSEVLDIATSSLSGALTRTDASLDASSKGLRESTDVLQPVEKGKPGLFPTVSPTSPLHPDVGSSSSLDVTPDFRMALAVPTTNTASGMVRVTADITSIKPSGSEGSTQSEEDRPRISWPLTEISPMAHLDQKSTSQNSEVPPSAETGFLTHRTVKEASVSLEIFGTSLSPPTLPTRMVPSAATHVATDVFHSSSEVTAHNFSESILRVFSEMRPGSIPTQSPEASSRNVTSIQEAALNGQGPGGSEPATRDPFGSPAIPTALPPSSAWPLASDSRAPATLPDFVTEMTSLGTEGLAPRSLPASIGSPKLDDATTLSTSTTFSTSPATAEKGTEVPSSRTPRMETSETRSGVGEGTVPSVRDLATVSALAGKETLGHLSTLQNVLWTGATSGFPVRSTSLPASRAPGIDLVSSTGAASQMETGPTSHSPHSSPAVSPSVQFPASTVPFALETVAADNSTEAVLSAHRSPTPGEGSTSMSSTSWINLSSSLGATEQQEGLSTTRVLPSPSPGEGRGHERKEGVSPTAETSTDVLGHTSILEGQSEPTNLGVSSSLLPTDASSLPAFSVVRSGSVETGSTVPSPHSWASSSTSEALPSADVTDLGSYREERQPKLLDGTGPITATAGQVPGSISERPPPAASTDSSSGITSATLGVPPVRKHFAFSTVSSRSTRSPPPSPTFLTTSGMAASKESSEPETLMASSATEGAGSVSLPRSTIMSYASTTTSNATLHSQFLDTVGDAQPFQTTAGGTHVGRDMGSPSTSPRRELFYRTPSPLPTLSQAAANRTEVTDTSRAMDPTTGFFVSSTSHRSSSQSANLSQVESKSTVMPQPNATHAVSPSSIATRPLPSSRILPTTRAVSPSSAATDLPASSRILPTTQTVSLSSTATDQLTSSKIIPTTSAVSPSSTAKDLPASSGILPTTQAVSPSSIAKDLPASSGILPTTQAVSPSSTAKDLPASSGILPTTQAVSLLSTAKGLLATSRILPTTHTVSLSSKTTAHPASSRILPTTSAVSPSSTAKDLQVSSGLLPTTQTVSPPSNAKDLLATSRILSTTQTVTLSSAATDLPASSRILSTTQVVSPSSKATDHPASSRILPSTQIVSPSSAARDQPASSRILPTTQVVSPSSTATDLPASTTILHTTSSVSPSSTATDLPASSGILPTTQAVSPSSAATDQPASSRILPTTQAVSPSSASTDQPASSRILPTTQAVSPSSAATDQPASSRILPTISAVSSSFTSKDLPATSRILPITSAVSPSPTAEELPTSFGILPTIQAVSPSSTATDLPSSSRIIPTTQAGSLSSAATDHPASSRILPTISAVSPSSTANDLPVSSRILSTTQTVSPSSTTKDLLATSRILPSPSAVSPSSTAKDLLATFRILPTPSAVSPSSTTKDLLATSRILPTTSAVSPSSTAEEFSISSRILPTTQAVSPSSTTKDLLVISRIRPTPSAVSLSSTAKDLLATSRILPTTSAVSPSSTIEEFPVSSGILPTTQAVSPSSTTKDMPASSKILPTTQAVSPSLSATDTPASSRILPTTQVVSPPSTAKDLLATSRIFPTPSAVSPSSTTKDLLATSRILPTPSAVSPSSTAKEFPVSSRILPTTQAVSPSSTAKDLPASSRILPITQDVSPPSTVKYLLSTSRILPTTSSVSPSSTAKDLPVSSRILPTTQAVSPSSAAKDLPASSEILPTTQAGSPPSTAKDLPASSKILPTTSAVSLSSTATNPPASSRILPTTQAVSPSSAIPDLLVSSRILPTIQTVSPSSSVKDLPVSSGIIPTTEVVSPSSSATDPPAGVRILSTTQAVSSVSSTTDLPAIVRILPTTSSVSPSSSITDPPTSFRILPTTQAVSPSSSTTDTPASSGILPTASLLTTRAACGDVHCLNSTYPASFAPLPKTSAQLPMTPQTVPPKVLITTRGSTVGKKGTTAGSSTEVDTPKVTYTTSLTGMKLGTITRDGPTSEHLVSSPRASTIGHTAERDNITLSKRTLAVSILPLEFHLTGIDYTESLANKFSARYKKLEREVILTLNKMLSFYETFLRASVLRFLNGSVIAQTEAVFRGDGLVPTPLDVIRTIVNAAEQREIDAFFDWRVDLRSIRCNGFSLKNLDPVMLAISFTVLGQGSIATFGGSTDWGPLERLRNEVIQSLGTRYRVQNFSLVQVRNVQGDLEISGELYMNTAAHVDVSWALEALKGLANYSVDLGSVCINDFRLSLEIFPVSFLVTNRLFSEKLRDRSSTAHQSLSWDLSKTLMHILGQFKNLLQVTIREVRGGSLMCYADMVFEPPAPTSKDLVEALALSVGPKNYLGASGIQVDPYSFTVAGVTLEPPFANPRIPGYGIALIVLSGLALIVIPFLVLLLKIPRLFRLFFLEKYKHLGWKEKMVIHRVREPEVTVETFELDNPTFRPLTEDNSAPSSSPTVALG